MTTAVVDEQKQAISKWIDEGKSLSEVQQQLQEQFKTNLTFMELRFLVDDLDLELKNKKESISANTDLSKTATATNENGVTVSVDKVQRPGAMLSGSATFSGGTLAWQLDQMGQLGLIPGKDGYRPDEAELAEFQTALKDEPKKHGF